MRVLQVGPYPPPHGGVETNLVAVRDHVRRTGGRCGVVNITRHRKAAGDEVHYPDGPLQTLGLLFRLPYDVLHLHIGGAVPLRVLALAFACTCVPGKGTVLTFHSGGYTTTPEGRSARPGSLRGIVFRRFDRIIAVNQEIVALFGRFGVCPDRIRLIAPHALQAGEPDASLPPRLEAFFETHRPVLLSVGGLEPEYDVALQIEVLGALRERHPEAGLAAIGCGSLAADLQARAGARPYASHVLLCGDVPHTSTLRAIRDCDVLLRTTLYDGDAISVREALHVGTPVVATDNGMRPDGVLLARIGDPGSVLEACEKALAGGRARPAAAEPDFSNLDAVIDLYRELL